MYGAEKSLCPGGCGHPAEVAWDDDNDGWFEVDTKVVCHACAAISRWQTDGAKHADPGALPVVIFTRPPADDD